MGGNIEAITKFIFLSDQPQKSDVIISPGTFRDSVIKGALKLYKEGFAPYVATTGGAEKEGICESEYQRDFLINNGVDKSNVLTEMKSANTKENAIEIKKVLNRSGLSYGKILLVSKTYHSRRIYMTFKSEFPDSRILIYPVVDDREITKDNWYKADEKIKVVMNELQKIGEYYLKGDLSL